ncbi:MAG: SMC family ATPase [Candidatus Viridilinea halotolerans]|uniref:Nuclease SbcCD subunit C n=1 Tax=Candidatus Viridilinea halotolerans TaxID=2491704 RepID=A0A426UB12_9CHLR|nr:MAG: SMC family ATPase [Candidatus Viridilinea halotolerans]
MIPTKLTLNNFMCYRADGDASTPPTLDFAGLHVVCLSGENGAGKSALLDAITWALWGEARMSDDDLVAQGQHEMSVELEFALGDLEYRVTRRRQRGRTSKRGTPTAGKSHLDLQVCGAQGWRPIAETGVRETQMAINALLRMSYATFINASFLLQGRADEFTSRTAAERKQVLADILDLGEYDALATRARERAKTLADQITGLRGAISQLENQAAELTTWQSLLAQAEATVAQQQDVCAQAETTLAATAQQLAGLNAKAEQRKTLLRELEALRKNQAQREQELADLRLRIAQAEKLLTQRTEIEAGLVALAQAHTTLERLDHLRDEHTALTQRQAELRQQFSEAKGELRKQLGALEQRQAQLEQQVARRAQLADELHKLATQLAALGPRALEHEACSAERHALEQRAEQLAERLRQHDRLQAQINQQQQALVAARDEQQRSLQNLERQLANVPHWREELAAAQAAEQQLATIEAELAALRSAEQAEVDGLSQQRAESTRLKASADKLKANQKILADAGGACPVCRSDLGETGVAHVQAHYAEELESLRTSVAATKQQISASEARLAQTRSSIGSLETQLAALRRHAAQVPPLTSQLAQAEVWQSEHDTTAPRLAQLQAQLDTHAFAPEAQAELATLKAEVATLGEQADLTRQRKQLDQRLRDLDKQLRQRDQLAGQQHARQDELARIDAELDELPALQTQVADLRHTIEQNDFAHEIRTAGEQVSQAVAALGYHAADHSAAREQVRTLDRWRQAEQELRLAEQQLAADQKIHAQTTQLHQHAAANLEQQIATAALLDQELRELPRAQADHAAQQQMLGDARRSLEVARNDRAEKSAHVRRAEVAAAELAQRREAEQQLVAQHSLFAELTEAFGKKGVQAMLIEQAVPQIEDEANRLLGRMTDGQMHLSLDMQRETKKGDTVETLEIKIADALGTRIYDAFSGGEAMRVNFAIRIALSRLLARRAGARLETLVIDEGFGTLDALGRERMVEAITTVQNDFKRIIVITHIDELKDRFPAQIEITKRATGSQWELR